MRRSSRRCAKATWCRSASFRRATAPAWPNCSTCSSSSMPNPTEGNPPQFCKAKARRPHEVRAEPDPHEARPGPRLQGRRSTRSSASSASFRVHQGDYPRDTQLFIGDGRKPFKVGHLFLLQGKDIVETDALRARRHRRRDQGRGDPLRCGAARLARRGPHPSVAARISDADARLAIEPKRRGDEQRISEALHKLAAEDPTLQHRSQRSTRR